MPPNFSICRTCNRSTVTLSFPDRQHGERLYLHQPVRWCRSNSWARVNWSSRSQGARVRAFSHLPSEEPSAAPLGCAHCGCRAPGALLEHCLLFSVIPSDFSSGVLRSWVWSKCGSGGGRKIYFKSTCLSQSVTLTLVSAGAIQTNLNFSLLRRSLLLLGEQLSWESTLVGWSD